MSDSENEEDRFSSSQNSSDESSFGYDGAVWMDHINPDGSLLYIESYVSSTVKEKQALALKTSRQKKSSNNDKTQSSVQSKIGGMLKKENKLLGLLRRRPSIRARAPSLSLAPSSNMPLDGNRATAPSDNATSDGGTSGVGPSQAKSKDGKARDASPAPKVTFRDNKSGETRTVVLSVVNVGDGRGGLCEAVLGVVAGRFSEPPAPRIMVAGILPGSEAHTTHAIKIGDWLKEINCKEVTWDNIDSVLGEIRVPSVVTLGLQKCASETLTDQDHHNGKRITQTRLVKHVTGASVREAPPTVDTPPTVGVLAPPSVGVEAYQLVKGAPPHAALLLSLTGVTDTSPEGSDIRYQFPLGSSRLVRVRGVFLTLAHTMFDMTQQHVSCTSVQLGSGELVHAAYRREEDLVWVMALPDSYCSEHELLCLSQRVTDNLVFEFGSLAKCFSSASHTPYLHHLLGKVFSNVLHPPSLPPSLAPQHYLHPNNIIDYPPFASTNDGSVWSVFSAPPWLVLQDGGGGAKMEVDTCLSELEAGDFGVEDVEAGGGGGLAPTIEGCCLFYKGALVASHLPPLQLRSLYTHCRLHGLLGLTAREAVSQLVVWRPCTADGLTDTSAAALLVVAMNHLLMAMIVDEYLPSHGGRCRGPDPLLVEQVEATLYHLHSLHIPALCQDSLSRGGPEVVCADQRYTSAVPGVTAKAGQRLTHGSPPPSPTPDAPSSILKQRPVVGGDDPGPPLAPTPHLVGEDSEDEEEEQEDHGGSQWRLWRGQTPSPSFKGSDADPAPLHRLPVSPIRVTTGATPALFHLVHLDVGEGVLIESLPPNASHSSSSAPHPPSPLHHAVMENFKAACTHIHRLLHSSIFTMLEDSSGGAREHGVLFSYTPPTTSSRRRPPQPFNYWVVGRVMAGTGREVYVCYHEDVPQNLHEMAAKLGLGATL